MWAGPAYSTPSRTSTLAVPSHAKPAKVISTSTAVAVQAATAGIETMNASHRLASSIVACTHQRSGTNRRSW